MLYPLKFKTIYKDKIWGGNKIKTVLHKDFGDLPNCGETWEVSGVQGNISEVAEGALKGKLLTDLIQEYQGDLVGQSVYQKFGEEFPLLIKFIDANDDLSIQVHPDDDLARQRHDSFGKTEMWYVLQADEGASLISGFNQDLTKEKYLEYFESGRLEEILNREQVKTDDVFFLPAGRVHTIGKGLMIAEIQQTSDITYRIYDFDRVDDQGNTRELHVEEALDAIDFKKYDEYKTVYDKAAKGKVPLVQCSYFETNKLSFSQSESRDLAEKDSFVIYIVLEGSSDLEYEGGKLSIGKGDCILVPASIDQITLHPQGEIKMLETYIP